MKKRALGLILSGLFLAGFFLGATGQAADKTIIRLADDKSDLLLSLAKVYESVGVEHMARQAQRQARKLKTNDRPGS